MKNMKTKKNKKFYNFIFFEKRFGVGFTSTYFLFLCVALEPYRTGTHIHKYNILNEKISQSDIA